MDILSTRNSVSYVIGFNISLEEVIQNALVLSEKINQFYETLWRVMNPGYANARVPNGVFTFNIPGEVIGILTTNGPLTPVDGHYGAPEFTNLYNKYLGSIYNSVVTAINYEVVEPQGIGERRFVFSLVDPLILNILIAKNQFHHFVLAVKSIQDEQLRKTLIGIMKYSLQDEELILRQPFLRQYVFSSTTDRVENLSPNIVFVKLNKKSTYYTIDYRLLTKFNSL
jgi:hypothetical protein